MAKLGNLMKESKVSVPGSFGVGEIHYNYEKERLTVQVLNHGTHQEYLVYTGVPVDVYESFLVAGSKGGFFNKEIRNKYYYEGKK